MSKVVAIMSMPLDGDVADGGTQGVALPHTFLAKAVSFVSMTRSRAKTVRP